ncbi:hypothetical protein E4U32_006624 [Claviceps aff. humidiphila group G2b]|nr:hypothetical protein E4U32_006624 [Claviceps aff. humidiphila group G2b]
MPATSHADALGTDDSQYCPVYDSRENVCYIQLRLTRQYFQARRRRASATQLGPGSGEGTGSGASTHSPDTKRPGTGSLETTHTGPLAVTPGTAAFATGTGKTFLVATTLRTSATFLPRVGSTTGPDGYSLDCFYYITADPAFWFCFQHGYGARPFTLFESEDVEILIGAIKRAPRPWKATSRQKLSGDLLSKVFNSVKAQVDEHIKQARYLNFTVDEKTEVFRSFQRAFIVLHVSVVIEFTRCSSLYPGAGFLLAITTNYIV